MYVHVCKSPKSLSLTHAKGANCYILNFVQVRNCNYCCIVECGVIFFGKNLNPLDFIFYKGIWHIKNCFCNKK